MQTTRLVVLSLISAAFAGTVASAHADGLTRDQVRAETIAAAKAGLIPHGDLDIVDIAPPASSSLDRATVKAELKSAVAAGDVEVGDSGRTAREITPSRYAAAPAAAGVTRAQVRQELAEAIRTGQLPQGDEDRTPAELMPQRYAATASAHRAM